MYCLQDGSALVGDQAEAETPTVVRPPRTIAKSPSPLLKYLAVASLSLLVILIAGAAGAFLVWNWLAAPAEDTARNVQPTITPQRLETPNPRAVRTPTPRPANTTDDQHEPPSPAPDNSSPDEDFVDPGVSRINFRRGRDSETISGRVDRERSFVLRTLGGQYLSSSINSPGNCVVFAGGSTSTGFSTSNGDSRLDLRNNCGQPARFTLTVTVR